VGGRGSGAPGEARGAGDPRGVKVRRDRSRFAWRAIVWEESSVADSSFSAAPRMISKMEEMEEESKSWISRSLALNILWRKKVA